MVHTDFMTKHDPGDHGEGSPLPAPATPDETRAELLGRALRDAAPIRKDFVQWPQSAPARPNMLHTFVNKRDLRALKAYLLLVAIISSGDHPDGWSKSLPLRVWARAFDTTVHAESASATAAVSKTLTRLVERRLIERARSGRARNVRVTLLREDGSGKPYTRPRRDDDDLYLRLPFAYWTEGWHAKLRLPGTAMLLVALHEKPVFQLPTEHMHEWYGWSPDTAERGFEELVRAGLLKKTTQWKKAPLSPTGLTQVNEYELIGAFKRTQLTKSAAKKLVSRKKPPAKKPVKGSATAKRAAVEKSTPLKKASVRRTPKSAPARKKTTP